MIRRGLAAALGVALLAACGGGGTPAPPSPTPATPPAPATRPGVLVIGIDGASFEVIDALGAATLPNLAALQKDGVRASLGTLYPTLSPSIWTTVATGKLPHEHGIQGFTTQQVLMAEESGAKGEAPAATAPPSPPPLATSNQRKVKALWNIATERGIRAAVLGWWVTWPAEPIDGLLVSDRVDQTRLEHRVHPPEEISRVDAAAVTQPPLTLPGAPETERLLVEQWSRSDRRFADLAKTALADPATPLVMVYLRGLDPIQHRFWKYWKPEGYDVRPEDAASMGRTIPDYYRFLDGLVGELLAARGGRTVVVLSDHGMHGIAGTPALVDPVRVLAALGLGPSDVTVSGSFLTDDAPVTIRAKAGVDVNPLAAQLREIHARRPDDTGGGGQPLFRVDARPGSIDVSVHRRFAGDDLVRLPHGKEVTLASLTGPLPPGAHSGAHDDGPDGVFLAAGATIRKGVRVPEMTVLDVAPLLLTLLDLPVAEDMVGRAWKEALATPPARKPLRTYEGTARQTGPAIPTEYDEEMREELRQLGYIR